jgi:mono/diheme cytochrome c family protein
MRVAKLLWMFAVLMFWAVALGAQDQSSTTTIKHVPVKETSPTSGAEMYKAYCAVCHGTAGQGDGPAAAALKAVPTNLTLLSKRNGGKFPDMKVAAVIRGEGNLAAHGTPEMPVWGSLFWGMSHGHEGEVQQRVANLTKYVEGLQAK